MALEELYNACARMAGGEGAGALASVARRRGSLPMSATAKMLVTADGARFGTVGGGCLEAEITERALDVVERRVPVITEHTLNSEIAGDYGLTCGGTAVMFIEPVFHDDTLRAVYERASQLLSGGERGILATAVDWSRGVHKAVASGAGIVGSADAAIHGSMRTFDGDREDYLLDNAAFVEPIRGAPRLVVFGGGHVGASVAQAAAFAGWRVTVVDDRPEYADATRLPFAERAMVCEYHSIPAALRLDDATYVVVATRGHQHDALVVEQLASRPLRYLGMLGSRRKVALTWQLLEGQGVSPVSIVAELIAVRRAGSRRRGGIDPAAPRVATIAGEENE
jgi:xanthine dehydrogenase accessory factor